MLMYAFLFTIIMSVAIKSLEGYFANEEKTEKRPQTK